MILDTILFVAVFLGLVTSILITVQHIFFGPHKTYDNWLLPVFIAVALQLWDINKNNNI